MLLLGPLAIRWLAVVGRRSPIAVRLALRDLARYQSRAGAALAAIGLALGVAAAVAIGAAKAQVHALQDRVDSFTAALHARSVLALDGAVDPAAPQPVACSGRARPADRRASQGDPRHHQRAAGPDARRAGELESPLRRHPGGAPTLRDQAERR